jgi:hypothetical protein
MSKESYVHKKEKPQLDCRTRKREYRELGETEKEAPSW